MNILLVKPQGRTFESSSFLYITTGNRAICKYSEEQGVGRNHARANKVPQIIVSVLVCI